MSEVSTGVDPVARERIWAVLEHMRSIGHTVIFTSFYTQECIHLTSKLVILAEGNVQCLGSPKDLQRRFARGYCITIRIRNEVLSPVRFVATSNERVNNLKAAIEKSFMWVINTSNSLKIFLSRQRTMKVLNFIQTRGSHRRARQYFTIFLTGHDSYLGRCVS